MCGASPTRAAASSVVDGLYRLSLAQYDRMAALGILTPDDRIVLLHGLLVPKMPHDPAHAGSLMRVCRALDRALPDGWHLRPQVPIALPDGPQGCASEPEPDVAVAVGVPEDYHGRHPTGPEVGLIVEVGAEAIELLPCYGFAGVPIVWIVDLGRRVVAVHEDPTGPAAGARAGYDRHASAGSEEALRLVLGGVEVGRIAVAALLPAARPDGPGREDA